jgi:hypothetical protein
MGSQAEKFISSKGPFPNAPIAHALERRWLHYAFITQDGAQALIANIAWLGGEPGLPATRTAILLAYERRHGWASSQWTPDTPEQPWSSFRSGGDPFAARSDPDFTIRAGKGWPAANLRLRRTSTPGIGGCATFHDNYWQRWQAEPGVLASGHCSRGAGDCLPFEAAGYHERVRGCWGWPQLGGWVFGFCNHVPGTVEAAPEWSVVFALLQPEGGSPSQTCVVMLWRRGRLVRFIPRRTLRVSAAGHLERDRVGSYPAQMILLGTGPMAPVPAALCITGFQGSDWVQLRFRSKTAARLIVPSETSLQPFSVHEVLGDMEVELAIGGRRFSFRSPAIVEFAGGATEGNGYV